MKKIILSLLCLAGITQLWADEFKATTMLSKEAVGIFDTVIVTGPATLGKTQIGAVSKTGSDGFLQSQRLIVYGIFGLLTPIQVGSVNVDLPVAPASDAKIIINRSLVLQSALDPATPIAYTFNDISIHPSHYLVVAGNMELNEIQAQTIETAETFANVTTGDITTLTSTPKAAYYNIGGRIMDSPLGFGSKTSWTAVQSTSGDEYGPWSSPQEAAMSDSCPGKDINNAYTCNNTSGSEDVLTCTDVRRITITNVYKLTERVPNSEDTTGGAMVFSVIGRKEGHYAGNQASGNSCYLDPEYTVRDSHYNTISACTNLGSLKVSEGADLGLICYAVCGNAPCASEKVCYDSSSPGASYKKNNTARTAWLDGSKLECYDMWEETVFPAIKCGAGAGAPTCGNSSSNQCARYQSRTVKCAKLESGNSIVPGTFLTLEY